MLTPQDRQTLAQKGISEAQLEAQLNSFKTGFPFLELEAPASVPNGILALDAQTCQTYAEAWDEFTKTGRRVLKFVPASGAASRMFKDLFAFVEATYNEPSTDFEKRFFAHIHDFAFFDDLNAACLRNEGKDIDTLMSGGQYKAVVSNLLSKNGLNYGQLPKGLLKFHRYADGARTPMEEHLVEAALYASVGGEANVHFTVSHEHKALFQQLVEQVLPAYEKKMNVHYHVSFSEQKPSTDTVAATPDGEPFRTDDGQMLFRPGGHGALIQNLNDLQADVVFVKNIDNVVPDRMKPETVTYKKVLAGVLVTLQRQVHTYLHKIESGVYSHADLEDIIRFVQQQLFCRKTDIKDLEDAELVIYLKQKLNRPMRVCGMVKNVGEAGGGPFLAYNADGTVSPQILESSQIDKKNPAYLKMFAEGTHFNPVDLVCAITDINGRKFDLPRYVDAATGFISQKSKSGRELQALELPGLWNGAMSDWITVFVDVPLATFNPVKTVNDLLRPEHQ